MIQNLAFVLLVATQIGGCLTPIAEIFGDEGATGKGAKNATKDAAPPGDERKVAGDQKRAANQAEGEKPKGPPMELTVDLGNGIKLEMVLVPAGSFTMGDEKGKPLDPSLPRSGPQLSSRVHKVTITDPLFTLNRFRPWSAEPFTTVDLFGSPK